MRGWGSESQPVGLATQPGPSTSPHSPPRPVGVGKKLGRWQGSVLRPWSPLRSKPKQMVGKNSGRNSGVGSRSLRVLLWAPPSDAGPPRAASGCVWSHTGCGGTDKGVRMEVPALGASAPKDQLAGQFRFCQGSRFTWGTGRLRCISVQLTSVPTVYVPAKC